MKLREAELVLREYIPLLTLSPQTLLELEATARDHLTLIREGLDKKNISAEVFLGGSLAKGTIIKQHVYDIDLFVRFYNSPREKISDILEKILPVRFKRVHGSRDYFLFKKGSVLIEVIPVLKINTPQEAENVTDLSYFHVNYVLHKIKQQESLRNEIIFLKHFCYVHHCYGAESYIKGFSGYALELLMCHYGSVLAFMKAIAALDNSEKIIIDDSGFYKNKEDLFTHLNEAKQQSPIILIDPTYKERNALSGLSEETFHRFKTVVRQFLAKPHKNFFTMKNITDEFKNKKTRVLTVKTVKQAGDIAGTKSKKFFDFFLRKLREEFLIKKSGFDYNEEENKAYLYIFMDKKKEEMIRGPHESYKEHFKNFKRLHKGLFMKKGYAYTKRTHTLSFERWFSRFTKNYSKIIKEMGIKNIAIEKR